MYLREDSNEDSRRDNINTSSSFGHDDSGAVTNENGEQSECTAAIRHSDAKSPFGRNIISEISLHDGAN